MASGNIALASLENSTDRVQLTALGQNNAKLHQVRVPRLEPGKGKYSQIDAAEALKNLTLAMCLVPNASAGILFAP